MNEFQDKYEGEFLNGLKHGFGTLFFTNGERFKGQFLHDKSNGIGTFYRKTGDEITAEWENNVLSTDF